MEGKLDYAALFLTGNERAAQISSERQMFTTSKTVSPYRKDLKIPLMKEALQQQAQTDRQKFEDDVDFFKDHFERSERSLKPKLQFYFAPYSSEERSAVQEELRVRLRQYLEEDFKEKEAELGGVSRKAYVETLLRSQTKESDDFFMKFSEHGQVPPSSNRESGGAS